MPWIIIGALVVVAAVFFSWLTSKGTVYWAHSNGFRAWSTAGAEGRWLNRDQIDHLLSAVLEGRSIDTIIVCSDEEETNGFTIMREESSIQVDTSFLTQKQKKHGDKFREIMSELGHSEFTENDWNEGMGEELASTTVACNIPIDLIATKITCTKLINDYLEIHADKNCYTSVMNIDDGPAGRNGLFWIPYKDYFTELIGKD